MGEWIATSAFRESEADEASPPQEPTMPVLATQPEAAIAVRTDLCAIFVSLELSRSTWLITSLSPGGGEKMSKYSARLWPISEFSGENQRLKLLIEIQYFQGLTPKMAKVELRARELAGTFPCCLRRDQ